MLRLADSLASQRLALRGDAVAGGLCQRRDDRQLGGCRR